jgi:hypothetical protein
LEEQATIFSGEALKLEAYTIIVPPNMRGGCACIEVVEEVVDVQSQGKKLTTPKAHTYLTK